MATLRSTGNLKARCFQTTGTTAINNLNNKLLSIRDVGPRLGVAALRSTGNLKARNFQTTVTTFNDDFQNSNNDLLFLFVFQVVRVV